MRCLINSKIRFVRVVVVVLAAFLTKGFPQPYWWYKTSETSGKYRLSVPFTSAHPDGNKITTAHYLGLIKVPLMDIEHFLRFAHAIQELRGDWTVKALSEKAKVSTKTIIMLENGRALFDEFGKRSGKEREVEHKKIKRRSQILLQSIARLAEATGQQPDNLLEQWLILNQHERDPVRVQALIRSVAGSLDRGTLNPSEDLPDTQDWFDQVREDNLTNAPAINFGILCDKHRSQSGRRIFFANLVEAVLHTIDPRIIPQQRILDEFSELYQGLHEPNSEQRLRLVAGLSESRYRRVMYGVDFVAIPGLQFHLACLVRETPEHDFDWWRIAQSPQSIADRNRVVVLAIDGEIGAYFLEEECGFKRGKNLHLQQPPIDFQTMAKEFEARLCEEVSGKTDKRYALVCDESWATQIRAAIKAFTLTDLSLETGADIPYHREAIVIAGTDRRWKTTLEDNIKKLFTDTVTAPWVASIYADYLVAMAVENESVLARLTDKAEKAIRYKVPNFARLQFFDFPVSDSFRTTLEVQLHQSDVLRKVLPNAAQRNAYIDAILPWRDQAKSKLQSLSDEIGYELLSKYFDSLLHHDTKSSRHK